MKKFVRRLSQDLVSVFSPGRGGGGVEFISSRARMGHGNPGKSWNFILAFSRIGRPGKLMQVLGSPGNLLTLCKSLVVKFSLHTIVCGIIFGFLIRKDLLFQLLCIWETWRYLPESWKKPGKVLEIFSEKGYEPCKRSSLLLSCDSVLFIHYLYC